VVTGSPERHLERHFASREPIATVYNKLPVLGSPALLMGLQTLNRGFARPKRKKPIFLRVFAVAIRRGLPGERGRDETHQASHCGSRVDGVDRWGAVAAQ
jgi:hypothetical protein